MAVGHWNCLAMSSIHAMSRSLQGIQLVHGPLAICVLRQQTKQILQCLLRLSLVILHDIEPRQIDIGLVEVWIRPNAALELLLGLRILLLTNNQTTKVVQGSRHARAWG